MCGRYLRKVPLDFDAPIGEVWKGYSLSVEDAKNLKGVNKLRKVKEYENTKDICSNCDYFYNDCSESARHCLIYNEEWRSQWFKEPPEGDGYQIWSSTSEGTPMSPVFDNIDDLCDYAEDNVTIFGTTTWFTKELWKVFLLGEHKDFTFSIGDNVKHGLEVLDRKIP